MARVHAGLLLSVLAWLQMATPARAQTPQFGDRLDLGLIEHDPIREASGLAASRQNAGVLWTHNDSGDRNRIFAFNTQGGHLGEYQIEGVRARDWEDMALGPGPEAGRDYLYLGDIGDNDAVFDLKYIHRVPEPRVTAEQAPVVATLSGVETIVVRYPDGNRDAETLMVDPRTRDLYVVSKREPQVRVYCAPYPQSTTQVTTLQHVATLPLTLAVGGDIATTGDEILIKTYDAVWYWSRPAGEKLAQALARPPLRLPYLMEVQGEAICWHPEGRGYYTLSEELGNVPAHLFFYPRLNSSGLAPERGFSADFALHQNHPNPFSPHTTIAFTLPAARAVEVKILDLLGQEVVTLTKAEFGAGNHQVEWHAAGLPSGAYLCRLQSGSISRTRKLLLAR